MEKIDRAQDISGRELIKGDTVSTLSGSMTARISDIAQEGDATFVRLRPMFQPYGPGVWHAADRVVYVAAGKKKNDRTKAATTPATTTTPAPTTAPTPATTAIITTGAGRNGKPARKK